MRERGPRQHERGDDREEGDDEPHAAEANAEADASLAASVPLYEYRCPNGHLFEVIHRMTEDGPAACEVCGAAPLQRVLHPVAVHYKGSGFYSTDYGRKSSKAAKDGSSSDSSSGGGSDSDSKKSSDSSSGNGESKKAAEA
jgi:putative FmdB family regulatory protein